CSSFNSKSIIASPARGFIFFSLYRALCITCSPLYFSCPCKGEDEGEGPYTARDFFRARFTIPPLPSTHALPSRNALLSGRGMRRILKSPITARRVFSSY